MIDIRVGILCATLSEAEYAIIVRSPGRASISDLGFSGGYDSNAIYIEDVNLPGARIVGDNLYISGYDASIWAKGA